MNFLTKSRRKRRPNQTYVADGVRSSPGRLPTDGGSGGGGICCDKLAGFAWLPFRRTLPDVDEWSMLDRPVDCGVFGNCGAFELLLHGQQIITALDVSTRTSCTRGDFYLLPSAPEDGQRFAMIRMWIYCAQFDPTRSTIFSHGSASRFVSH